MICSVFKGTVIFVSVMRTKIDFQSWKRKSYYQHFSQMDDPFYGVVFHLDVRKAYDFARENAIPFFLFYHYQSLQAMKLLPEFHYRLVEGSVYSYDVLNVCTTMLRDDETFAFLFIPCGDSFDQFIRDAEVGMQKVRLCSGINATEDSARPDLIHFSTVPWISFTDLSHAHRLNPGFGIPRITFGKFFEDRGKLLMPVSVHVHHGFVDGLHLGRFASDFQERLIHPELTS